MHPTPAPSIAGLIPSIREFVERELIPLEPAFLKNAQVLEPTLHELRVRVKELGLWGLALPADLGGHALPLTAFALVSEELGRTPTGHFVFGCQAPDIGNTELLHLHATSEQRTKFLEPLAAGLTRSCFAMTEPDSAGSNPTALTTRAVLEGDAYVINGHKWFTSSA